MQKINALGIKVAYISHAQALAEIAQYLECPHFHQVATVNPDFVMQARKNKDFADVLNRVDLALADGVGIHLPAMLQGKHPLGRIPGSDLTEEILGLAQARNLTVCLLARKDGLSSAELTRISIRRKYPRLNIVAMDVDVTSRASLSETLETAKGHIILCNFGAPLQDTFLSRFRFQNGDIRLVMGVGGTFDFLTGRQKRAPYFFRAIGVEWLWRLMCQPIRRFKRTWNYVIVYSFLCFQNAFEVWLEESHPVFHRFLLRQRS